MHQRDMPAKMLKDETNIAERFAEIKEMSQKGYSEGLEEHYDLLKTMEEHKRSTAIVATNFSPSDQTRLDT